MIDRDDLLELLRGHQMIRILLAIVLGLASVSASAVEWPWDEAPVSAHSPEYCKGFVAGGLASKELRGLPRIDLWQAWSYAIRSGALHFKGASQEYVAGLDQWKTVANTASAESTLQVALADGDCGLGRSGHQITGW